jgi:hypothetical protein
MCDLLRLFVVAIRPFVLSVRSFNSSVFLSGGKGLQRITMKGKDFGSVSQKVKASKIELGGGHWLGIGLNGNERQESSQWFARP